MNEMKTESTFQRMTLCTKTYILNIEFSLLKSLSFKLKL